VSPTQRSLKHMREQGYTCDVAEYWQAFARKRKDLFSIVDIVCLGNGVTVGVQATSLSNVSARVKKITECEHLGALRTAGWRLVVHGWGKGTNGRYRLREVDVS
jgi:hypothetical protein